jgi:DNA-binding SARP family transcriptional activator
VEFGILGPLVILGPEGPVLVRGVKRRALLAYLLVHTGEAMSLDRLVDDLWDGRPSSGARGTVQSYLSGVRKLIAGDDAVTLETQPAGYVLTAPTDCLDAARFEHLYVQATTESDPIARVTALDAALALWRGAPLGEFAGSAWADVEATRLQALRLQALQQRIDARLALGRHAEATPELEQLVREHGLDERFWAQLMLAYYRAGRQADALRAYRQVRSILAEELGVEAGVELATLERQILDHDPALTLVTGQQSRPDRVPLSARLGVEGAFVGRDDECARLDAAFEAVRSEQARRVVLVAGEPGIGKTTLVGRFAGAAHAGGAAVLYGHCDEGLAIPYQPWGEALTHLVRYLPDRLLDAHVAARGGELATLAPDLERRVNARRPASIDPEADRYLLFGAVVDVLARASGDAPVVLVLEDLHWADLPTLQLLRHVVAAEASLRLLVVATYRETDISDEHPLAATLAAMYRESGVERITLGGLGRDALGAILEAATGGGLDATGLELLDALTAETDGSPFFVIEVLRDLTETGTLRRRDGHWKYTGDAALRVPPSVREVVVQRVRRLDDPAPRLLSVAAVIGRDFDVDLLAAVGDLDELTVLDVLDAASAAALVQPAASEADRYTFVHALIAHALRDTLSPARRRRVHARIARALEAQCGDEPGSRIGELARHWLAAGEDPDKAVEYASRAGDLALAQLAPGEAQRWCRQALDVFERSAEPGDPRRGELLMRLGEAQRQTGDASHRETLLTAAEFAQRGGDTDLLVRAAIANSRGMYSRGWGADAERIAVLEAARAATESQAIPARAEVLATLASELTWVDRARMRCLGNEAIALARRLDDDATFVTVATRLEGTVPATDTLPQRVALARETIAAAERTRDPVARWYAAAFNYMSPVEAGDIETFRTRVDLVERLARQIGQPVMLWISALCAGLRELLAGRLELAEEIAAESLERGGDCGQADAFMYYLGFLGAIRLYQGRLDEVVDLVDQVAAAAPDVPIVRAARALNYSEVGRTADAQALLDADASEGFRTFPFDMTWSSSMAAYARVVAALGDRRAAASLVELIEPWRDRIAPSPFLCGCLAHPLGLALATIGRDEAADGAFAQAVAVHERLQAPILLAESRLEWARLLSRRIGDRARASELAHAARAVAREYGAASMERRAHELLGSLDGRPNVAPR